MERMRAGAVTLASIIGAIALTVAIGTVISACSAGGASTIETVGLVSPGRAHDADWTRLSRDAFESLVESRNLTGYIAEDVGAGQAAAAIEKLAAADVDLVFANDSRYAASAIEAAEKLDVPTLVWGPTSSRSDGPVAHVEIDAADAGFVVGVLGTYGTGNVAVLIADDGTAWDTRNWNTMAGGAIAGARHEDPRARPKVVWVRNATPHAMKRAANRLLNQGVMTLFTLGGRSTIGAFDAVAANRREQVFAGVIGDRAPVDVHSVVITSVIYNFDALFRRALADARAGRFGKKPYRLTLENGGLRLLFTGRTSIDTAERASAVKDALERGELDVPQTPTREAVLALLRERSPR